MPNSDRSVIIGFVIGAGSTIQMQPHEMGNLIGAIIEVFPLKTMESIHCPDLLMMRKQIS